MTPSEQAAAVIAMLLRLLKAACDAATTNRSKARRIGALCAYLEPRLVQAALDGRDLTRVETELRRALACMDSTHQEGPLGTILNWFLSRRRRSELESAERELYKQLALLELDAAVSVIMDQEDLAEQQFDENEEDAAQDMHAFLSAMRDAEDAGQVPSEMAKSVRGHVEDVDADALHIDRQMDEKHAQNDSLVGSFVQLSQHVTQRHEQESDTTRIMPSALTLARKPDGSVVRLGKGSFGEVLLGDLQREGDRTPRRVAVKRLRHSGQLLPSERIMLKLEADKWKSLGSHKNIVTLEGLCMQDGMLHIVMEYCDVSLHQVLYHRDMVLDEAQQLMVLRGVARGIAFVHSRGFVHRDIKPANVLLSADLGSVKLCDFGFASANARESQANQTFTVCGTPPYMAPEVLSFPARWNTRADVYSFAFLAWETIHAEHPYGAARDFATVSRQALAGRRPPFRRSVSPWLKKLVEECWAQKPDNRPFAQQVLERIQDETKDRSSVQALKAVAAAAKRVSQRLTGRK